MSTGTVKVLFNHTAAFTSMVCFSYLSCKVTFVTSSKKVQEQHTFVGNNGHLGFKHYNFDNYANYAHFLIYAIIMDCSPLALISLIIQHLNSFISPDRCMRFNRNALKVSGQLSQFLSVLKLKIRQKIFEFEM